MLRANPKNFFSRIVTGDETWVHHHDLETKLESMQWKHKGSPTPKKFRMQQSAGKIMATVFRGSEGVLFFGFHAMQDNHYWIHLCFHNGNFTREYQTETPRRGKLSAVVLQLHDNALAQKVTHIFGCYKEMWLHRA